jgi:hypothetical protein
VGQSDLPLAAGAEHVKAFKRAGWTQERKAKDAQFVLSHEECEHALSIPDKREVKRGLLQKQIQLAGLTEEEYLACFYPKRARKRST